MMKFTTKVTLSLASLVVSLAACVSDSAQEDTSSTAPQALDISGDPSPRPTPCDLAYADVGEKLAAAQSCLLTSTTSCSQPVAGMCCPVAVGDVSSPETAAYLAALEKLITKCPGYVKCTDALCPSVSGSCKRNKGPTPNLTFGVCETHPGGGDLE
jgi:hypothetical protein